MEALLKSPLENIRTKEQLKSVLGWLHDNGKHDELIQLAAKFEARQDISSEMIAVAQFYHARALRKLNKPREAIELLKRAATCNHTAAGATHALAIIYEELEDYQKAEEYGEQAKKLNHENAPDTIHRIKQKNELRMTISRTSTIAAYSEQKIEKLQQELEKLREENEKLKNQIYANTNNLAFPPIKPAASDNNDNLNNLLEQVAKDKAKNEEERAQIEEEKKQLELEKANFLIDHALDNATIHDLEAKVVRMQEEHVRLIAQRDEIEQKQKQTETKIKALEENSAKEIKEHDVTLRNLRSEREKVQNAARLEQIAKEITAREAEVFKLKLALEKERNELLAQRNQLEEDKESIKGQIKELEEQGLLLIAKEAMIKQREEELKKQAEHLRKEEEKLQAELNHRAREVSHIKNLANTLHQEEQKLANLKQDFDKRCQKREQELIEEESRIAQKKELIDKLISNAPRSEIRTAIEKNKISDFLEILDRNLYKINEFDERGQTLLHWAARAGNLEIVEMLLIAGAIFRESPFDRRTPLDCCPGQTLFIKNDKYAALKHKLSDPALRDKKSKMWSLLPCLLMNPVAADAKQFIQDNIKSAVSCNDLLTLKVNQLMHDKKELPAELNHVYKTYGKVFDLILNPEPIFKLGDVKILEIKIAQIIQDYKVCETISRQQKIAGMEQFSQVANELMKRLDMLIICRGFGDISVIKRILAAAKMEAAKYKLHYYFDRFKFLASILQNVIKGKMITDNEKIQIKRLLEENKYRVGKADDIINTPEKARSLRKMIAHEIKEIIDKREDYKTLIEKNLQELLNISTLSLHEFETFAKLFDATNIDRDENNQIIKDIEIILDAVLKRNARPTNAVPMPALAEHPAQAKQKPAPAAGVPRKPAPPVTKLPVVEGERNTIYASLEPTPAAVNSSQPQNPLRVSELFGEFGLYKPAAATASIQRASGLANNLLEGLIAKAKVILYRENNKEFVQIIFVDHKLVQQFSDELHKIGISNLGMKSEPRKPNVIAGKEAKEDKYIILLTSDEYNAVMNDKDAYTKLICSSLSQFSSKP